MRKVLSLYHVLSCLKMRWMSLLLFIGLFPFFKPLVQYLLCRSVKGVLRKEGLKCDFPVLLPALTRNSFSLSAILFFCGWEVVVR